MEAEARVQHRAGHRVEGLAAAARAPAAEALPTVGIPPMLDQVPVATADAPARLQHHFGAPLNGYFPKPGVRLGLQQLYQIHALRHGQVAGESQLQPFETRLLHTPFPRKTAEHKRYGVQQQAKDSLNPQLSRIAPKLLIMRLPTIGELYVVDWVFQHVEGGLFLEHPAVEICSAVARVGDC